ncbi:TRAP transporter large permease [Microbaculum marinisediminis]|uniref:TRAP transporter large permease protein n=1 Tax=Microbaculum marinisediminis TaxID=2931392 RepID=A0AAW5QVS8_9HYPH|nr:TRAP transporter large permease subunit [Microbaculum sp. A6E488]MCT8971808.1 TRAP transporter large permease subunit [Microbaculum sp. A6E488]
MTAFMLTTMVLLFALSVPIAIAILGASIGGAILFTSLNPLVVAQRLVATLDSFPLLAIPFFILAGNLMEAGGISRRLVEFAKSVVGGVQGGLACSCVLTCMIFASVSGSSIATTFAIGAIIIPAMIRHGYPVPFAAALQTTSAELGVIIPPSIPMILYGVSAEVSIGDLFVAGIGPGLLIGGALIIFVFATCLWNGWGKADGEGRMPLWPSLLQASWGLAMPVIVLGGIYRGIFTPTEASVVAVIYALFVGVVIYRTITLSALIGVLRRSVISSSVIMFIIAAAGVFSFLITRAGVPATIGAWLVEMFSGPVGFLLAVNAVLFLVGMFIETSAAIIVLAPILAPVAAQFGVNPVQFGLIMIVNLAMGMITPPFGVNLFAACQVAGISIDKIIGYLIPFVIVIIACLAVVTFVPEVSLFFLNVLSSR